MRGRGHKRSFRHPYSRNEKKDSRAPRHIYGNDEEKDAKYYIYTTPHEAYQDVAKIWPSEKLPSYGFAGGRILYIPPWADRPFFIDGASTSGTGNEQRLDACAQAMVIVKSGSGTLGIPGGRPDEKETPIATASRELKEETGHSYTFTEDEYLFTLVTAWPHSIRPHISHHFAHVVTNKAEFEHALKEKPLQGKSEVWGVVGMPLYAEYNSRKGRWDGLPHIFSPRGGSERAFGVPLASLLEFWLHGVLEWDSRAMHAFQYCLPAPQLRLLSCLTNRRDLLLKRRVLIQKILPTDKAKMVGATSSCGSPTPVASPTAPTGTSSAKTEEKKIDPKT